MLNPAIVDASQSTLSPPQRLRPRQRLSLREHAYPGLLVTFCGIDGSGKTSMIEATSHYLELHGLRCYKTYTPTPRIRKNPLFRELVDASTPEARAQVDVLGMGQQILGDLLQHMKDSIVPRLAEGEVVLCDRYVFTSLAEVRARTDDVAIEKLLAAVASMLPRPDLAIALDAPPQLAEKRVRSREAERDKPLDSAFVARQAHHYLAVAKENDLLVVSSAGSPEQSFARIKARLDACLAVYAR
jgi:dTMP kinase